MKSKILISFEDLQRAFEWVSAGAIMENSAYISRVTGKMHWSSTIMELEEEELPEDIEDGTVYVSVPHKNDLDLGRDLVFAFAAEHLPQSYEIIRGFFRKRGAYARFKDLVEHKGQLETWYDYEA